MGMRRMRSSSSSTATSGVWSSTGKVSPTTPSADRALDEPRAPVRTAERVASPRSATRRPQRPNPACPGLGEELSYVGRFTKP